MKASGRNYWRGVLFAQAFMVIFLWQIGFTHQSTVFAQIGGNTNLLSAAPGILSATSTPSTNGPYRVITGPGYLTMTGSLSNCVYGPRIWLTNFQAVTLTNGTININFAIAGGSNGIAYDLFARQSLLGGLTNAVWAWLGQGYSCTRYTITNLPAAQAFFVLGSALDSDGDGLTDAYELLVSHTNPYNPDTDGDGLSDGLEVLDHTDPLDPGNDRARLTHWTFDGPLLLGDSGQIPIVVSNVEIIPGLITNAIEIHSPLPVRLAYNLIESNGYPNLNLTNGAVRFHFKPNWNFGSGPEIATLLSVGEVASTNGWWALLITNNGTEFSFVGHSNIPGTRIVVGRTFLTALLANPAVESWWREQAWYDFELSYSPSNSSLLITDPNGIPVTAYGTGVNFYPNAAEQLLTGFGIGSDLNGLNQAQGSFDDLETFNAPLDPLVGAWVNNQYLIPTEQVIAATNSTTARVFCQKPLDLVLSADKSLAFVKDAKRLAVYTTANWAFFTNYIIPPLDDAGLVDHDHAMHGIALSPDGQHVYTTDFGNHLLDWLVTPTNGGATLALSRSLNLSGGTLTNITGYLRDSNNVITNYTYVHTFNYTSPCGLAISADGTTAYVCLAFSNSLAVLDLPSGLVTGYINVGVQPYALKLSPDGRTAYVSDYGGFLPQPGEINGATTGVLLAFLQDTNGVLTNYAFFGDNFSEDVFNSAIIDARGIADSGALSIVDLAVTKAVLTNLPTGLHPSDLVLSVDGSVLYVANANSDTVTVINTQARTVLTNVLIRPYPGCPYNGSTPNALALNTDGSVLFVALAGNNAVAWVSTSNYQTLGFVPTDWYPDALATDGQNLYVANNWGLGFQPSYPSQDAPNLFSGSVEKIAIPATSTLSNSTTVVQLNGRIPQMSASTIPPRINRIPVPVPKNVGEPSVLSHVFYIIKENKTYDTMLGDLPQGNGTVSNGDAGQDLCLIGNYYTPNQHRLATQFVLLDNYYCNGVDSDDGHAWCTEANATDLLQKTISLDPRRQGYGADVLSFSASGFIWDNLLAHGQTFTNYGELASSYTHGLGWLDVYNNYLAGAYPAGYLRGSNTPAFPPLIPNYLSTLNAHTSPAYPGWDNDLNIPDQLRADVFIHDLTNADQGPAPFWPAFTIMHLPNDHGVGGSGHPTEAASVVDNDLATGRIVDAISHSRFWSNSVVFVIEDDPNGGLDHVDGHRSVCFIASPYARHGQTISAFYNQTGLMHTMEQILGLPPMNQLDAIGPLMNECFTPVPDFSPFVALSNNLPLNTLQASLDKLPAYQRYWVKKGMQQDYSRPDLADPNVLSRILWYSIRGNIPYPSRYSKSDPRKLKKLGLILTKSSGDDDDD